MKDRIATAAKVVGVALLVYLAFASIVFQFRHPWMTETERFLYTWEAITFGTVEYAEARPRETKD